MVLYDMQEFGGLEEYVTNLSIGLQQQGHRISIVSTAWIPTANQYLRRLRTSGITVLQLPKWISQPASDWQTKERILNSFTFLFSPVILLLALVLIFVRRQPATASLRSARNWFRAQAMGRFVGLDWRKPFVRFMLWTWKLRWRPDILHIQGYTNSLLFVIDWAYSQRLPIVYEEHQTPDAQFDWWRGFKHSINKADLVVAVSEKSADALRSVCGVTQPIAVQGPLVPDPIASGFQMDALTRNGDALQLTTSARLFVTKGLVYLLEAFKLIKDKHPGTQLKVYGEGPLRDELLGYADKLGLDGDDIFVGAFTSRDDLHKIMSKTDIFVLPSILEGQPVSLVEAMAYGCPIIATKVGGIPELILDGVNGFLCVPADADCLSHKIDILIENPAFRSELGNAARKSYEQGPFQPCAVCENFSLIYTRVLKGR